MIKKLVCILKLKGTPEAEKILCGSYNVIFIFRAKWKVLDCLVLLPSLLCFVLLILFILKSALSFSVLLVFSSLSLQSF